MSVSALAAAFIPGYSGHIGGPNGTVTRIVMHGTVSPTVRGGARNVAGYFQSPSAGGLAHYVVDPGEIVACCDEDYWCWHAPPNPGSIGIELCDPVDGDPARWDDADHQSMLALAGRLVADISSRRSVPVVYAAAADLLAGRWGVTGHVDVDDAFHESDHTDPGAGFPWASFIPLAAGGVTTGGTDVPAPTDHVRRIDGPAPGSSLTLTADGGVEFRGLTAVPQYTVLANTGEKYRFPWVPAPGQPAVIAYPGLPGGLRSGSRYFADIWLGWRD